MAGAAISNTVNRNVGVNRTASGAYIGFSDFYNLGYILMNSDSAISDGTGTTAYMSNAGSGYSYYGINTTSTNTDSKFAGKTAIVVFRSWPNNFLLSGLQNGASTGDSGLYGTYWSSTATTDEDAYLLLLNAPLALVRPGTNHGYKSIGFSVRCVIGS